jgi:hypothetical protein
LKTLLATLAAAGLLFHAEAASAAPTAGRVAILGPEHSALVPRLQRNFAENPSLLATAIVTSCARVTVAKNLYDLDADTGICTDGDVVTVWRIQDDVVTLVDAVPIVRSDDRSIEVLAARVTIAARTGQTSNSSAATTIIANGGGGGHDAATIMADANGSTTIAPARDTSVSPAPTPPERIAPRAILGVGPMYLASKAGGSFAISAEAEIGVSRVVAFVPWIATIPVPRDVANGSGSASYRPTIFGLGFSVPLRSWTKTIVPRIGAGYALLWMHTWPGTPGPGATANGSEDVWAPAMYASFALSVGITRNLRVAGEGMLGTSSHHMIVRVGQQHAADWGVPIASLGLRAEVQIP